MSDIETTDPVRKREIEHAWHVIETASHAEKEFLFKSLLEGFEAHEARFEQPDNVFDSYATHAEMAMDRVISCMRRLTGYDFRWVQERYVKHCSHGKGRPSRYDYDTREVNCIFIALMVARGSSETQAMKLLIRLRGDAVVTEGHLRELRNTYRDFRKLGRPTERDLTILDNATNISFFLQFDISNLKSEEKAFEKAVTAFKSLFQEIIDLMKTHHDLIAANDKSYPELFGCVIDWVKADYSNPLDYFYKHPRHTTEQFWDQRRKLTLYLHAVSYFSKPEL